MIKTVVFDLDDTLYDEIEYCKSGFTAAADYLANLPASQASEHIANTLFKQFNKGNRTRIFNKALKELGISFDDELIGKLVDVYRKHKPAITLPPESKDVLELLGKKYKLGLLTDGFLPAQKLKVRALGLEKIFECIIYTEELGRQFWKPSPAGFEKIIKSLKTKPESTAYVADNAKKDFIAPNKLGFLTIQLVRPARIHTEEGAGPEAEARYVISQISELALLLDNL
ncbi:HAD family hydrolase [Planctomycetota bacterium]